VAAEINVSTRTVRRMCERGELPAFKAGRQWRIRTDWRSHLEAQSSKN
jgi:excisionase family DNA binding protein